MEYLLSVYIDESQPAPSKKEFDVIVKDTLQVGEDLKAAGAFVFAGGLVPSGAAITMRPKGDDVMTTDGPYAETKEVIGGFWIINVPDEDTARKWAERSARACQGAIEMRAFDGSPDTYDDYLKSEWRDKMTSK